MMFCPRCGQPNPVDAEFCQNRSCRRLFKPDSVPQNTHIAPEPHTGPRTAQPPQEDPSSLPPSERASEGHLRRSVSAPPPRHLGRRGLLASVGLAALPILYVGGYMHGISVTRQADRTTTPPRIVISGGVTGTPAPNPTHAVTRPSTTPSGSPVISARPTPTARAHTVTIHGMIENTKLTTQVWAATSPNGPLVPENLVIDTGAFHTMISGYFWRSLGDHPTGQTEQISGVGGTATVDFWPNVWVFPTDSPTDPLLAGAVEPGGMYQSPALRLTGVVLIGQDVLSQGQLVQTGTTWTFTYTPQ